MTLQTDWVWEAEPIPPDPFISQQRFAYIHTYYQFFTA